MDTQNKKTAGKMTPDQIRAKVTEALAKAKALGLTVSPGAESMLRKNNLMILSALEGRIAKAEAAAKAPPTRLVRTAKKAAPAAQPNRAKLTALGEKADDDDGAAIKELTALAYAAGLNPRDGDSYPDWSDLAAALAAGKTGTYAPKTSSERTQRTYEEVATHAEIKVSDSVTIKVRTVKVDGNLTLDIREFLSTPRYTGHTSKGVAIRKADVAKFGAAVATAMKSMIK